jgi:hypothetical protein
MVGMARLCGFVDTGRMRGTVRLAPSLSTNDHTGRVRVGTVGHVATGRRLRSFVTKLVRPDRDGSVTLPSVATSGTHPPA